MLGGHTSEAEKSKNAGAGAKDDPSVKQRREQLDAVSRINPREDLDGSLAAALEAVHIEDGTHIQIHNQGDQIAGIEDKVDHTEANLQAADQSVHAINSCGYAFWRWFVESCCCCCTCCVPKVVEHAHEIEFDERHKPPVTFSPTAPVSLPPSSSAAVPTVIGETADEKAAREAREARRAKRQELAAAVHHLHETAVAEGSELVDENAELDRIGGKVTAVTAHTAAVDAEAKKVLSKTTL